MNILDSKTLKAQARQILGETPCDIKKLTLIYCAVATVLPIFMEILSVLVLHTASKGASKHLVYGFSQNPSRTFGRIFAGEGRRPQDF